MRRAECFVIKNVKFTEHKVGSITTTQLQIKKVVKDYFIGLK